MWRFSWKVAVSPNTTLYIGNYCFTLPNMKCFTWCSHFHTRCPHFPHDIKKNVDTMWKSVDAIGCETSRAPFYNNLCYSFLKKKKKSLCLNWLILPWGPDVKIIQWRIGMIYISNVGLFWCIYQLDMEIICAWANWIHKKKGF